MFYTLSKTEIKILASFVVCECLQLDQSKILSSGKELSKVDSVGQRSDCTFCAVYSESSVAAMATLGVEGALGVKSLNFILSTCNQLYDSSQR